MTDLPGNRSAETADGHPNQHLIRPGTPDPQRFRPVIPTQSPQSFGREIFPANSRVGPSRSSARLLIRQTRFLIFGVISAPDGPFHNQFADRVQRLAGIRGFEIIAGMAPWPTVRLRHPSAQADANRPLSPQGAAPSSKGYFSGEIAGFAGPLKGGHERYLGVPWRSKSLGPRFSKLGRLGRVQRQYGGCQFAGLRGWELRMASSTFMRGLTRSLLRLTKTEGTRNSSFDGGTEKQDQPPHKAPMVW